MKQAGRIRYVGITTSFDNQYGEFEQTMKQLVIVAVPCRQFVRIGTDTQLRKDARLLQVCDEISNVEAGYRAEQIELARRGIHEGFAYSTAPSCAR